MAGGEGSRLRPVTSGRPKPLVPICNEPIMEHIVRLLAKHGYTDVVATLHYLAHEIQAYFGDGSDFGVAMHYSVEDTPLGTAGSVKQAEYLLKDDTFLIISGDALTDCDLTAALAFHRAKGSLATMILTRVQNPLDFGVVITDEEHRITRFLEKPTWSEVFSDTVNTGMYILEPEVLDLIKPGQNCDWSQDVFPELLRLGKPMFGYVMEGYWADVGSLQQYREAQEHLMSRQIAIPIAGDEISPGVFADSGCKIDDQAVIVPPVCLGRNCKIKAGARIGPYTVIGDNALVEEGAIIDRSIVWDSAYVGPSVEIRSSTCCSRVTVKKDSILLEDSVIGDRCLLDVGCVIRPRVKIWPDKVIERGSTVTMSLIWGNKWRGSLFRDLGVAGLSNIELTPDFATRLGSSFGSLMPPNSEIVTSRDSTRSSRMLKRALIASLLSVGCDVLDMRGAAVPIVRHFIKTSGAAGGVHVRKLPGNSRVSLIEFFDQRGATISRNMERKIEATFSREDFNRTDPDDLGTLEYASRALEGYQDDFLRLVPPQSGARRLRIVCDYGYSPLAATFPTLLAEYGVDMISLNSVNDAKLAPRTAPDVDRHTEHLREIVHRLEVDMGVLFTEEGERLTLVDDKGNILVGNQLLAAIGLLVAKTHEHAKVGLSITAPSRLEDLLHSHDVEIVRTKADTRSLTNFSVDSGVIFAGDDRGGFLFPKFHAGFDAMFTFVQLLTMLQQSGQRLSDISELLPKFEVAYDTVRCPWDMKGAVMRQLGETSQPQTRIETLDGLKIYQDDNWVLLLPDALEPLFHVYAESNSADSSKKIVLEYKQRIEQITAATV